VHSLPGVHLQLSPVNLAKKIFSALGVYMHPVHPLATPMFDKLAVHNTVTWKNRDIFRNRPTAHHYGLLSFSDTGSRWCCDKVPSTFDIECTALINEHRRQPGLPNVGFAPTRFPDCVQPFSEITEFRPLFLSLRLCVDLISLTNRTLRVHVRSPEVELPG